MRELLHSVALRAARYLEDLHERRVSPSAEAVRELDKFIETEADVDRSLEARLRIARHAGGPSR